MSDNKLEAGSVIQKIINDRMDADKRDAIIAEEVEEYTKALNGMANSPNGKLFMRKLVRYCGVFAFDQKIDPAKLVADEARRKVYLELVRPYLTNETRMELER